MCSSGVVKQNKLLFLASVHKEIPHNFLVLILFYCLISQIFCQGLINIFIIYYKCDKNLNNAL